MAIGPMRNEDKIGSLLMLTPAVRCAGYAGRAALIAGWEKAVQCSLLMASPSAN